MPKGVKTGLRPVVARDHAALAGIRRDIDLQRRLLGAREPVDEPVTDWLDRRSAEGWIKSVVDLEDSCLGYVQLSEVHRNNRTAWFGICLVPAARGLGHGMAATLLTLETARKDLGLRKVSLKVRADNPAFKLYQRLGFRLVGTQRADYDDGQTLHDVSIMEFLFSEHEDT